MSQLIAIAGKGGVGKSTFSALLIRYFLLTAGRPILAVDADPNSTLPVMLGLKPAQTIGEVLEQFKSAKLNLPTGMGKQAWLQLRLSQAVAEGKGLDLLVMGRPEGEGCYCSPNAVLREFLDRMRENYKWVVVDNEAGLEHLSRRTEGKIDYLFVVSDPTIKGLRTVNKVMELIAELKLDPKSKYLVLNKTDTPDSKLSDLIAGTGTSYLGAVPEDRLIEEYDLAEKSLLELPEASPAVLACQKILGKVFGNQ